jgi:glycosyltransferase involved in cell wall biosynthesis
MNDVSVIIPTWNRADTIEKAVRSALDQTIPPLEVLVCDDGSTDNTHGIIRSINDPIVKWIEAPRSGRPAIPRNRGIRKSRGEWLSFLDSDDEWLPEKLEKQLFLVEKLNCKAACTNAYQYIPGKKKKGELLSWDQEKITFKDLLKVNQIICSSTLIHRSLFEMIDGFPEGEELKGFEDYALWLRVATQTDFSFLNEPLLFYCDDPENSIRREGVDVWSQRQRVLMNFRTWGKKKNISNEYLREAKKQCFFYLFQRTKTVVVSCARKLKLSFLM